MSGRVGYSVIGAGLIGGVAAVAMTLGLGGVDAGASDQQISLAAAGQNADASDLLAMASTNFLDAKDIYTGIDTTELSDQVASAVEGLHRQADILDRAVNILDNHVSPAEAAILSQSGSMAELIDQLFFTPLNQQWADSSESMLTAMQAFDGAVASGSMPDIMAAGLQMLGVDFFQVIPAALMSVPVVWIGSLFDDAVSVSVSDLGFQF